MFIHIRKGVFLRRHQPQDRIRIRHKACRHAEIGTPFGHCDDSGLPIGQWYPKGLFTSIITPQKMSGETKTGMVNGKTMNGEKGSRSRRKSGLAVSIVLPWSHSKRHGCAPPPWPDRGQYRHT